LGLPLWPPEFNNNIIHKLHKLLFNVKLFGCQKAKVRLFVNCGAERDVLGGRYPQLLPVIPTCVTGKIACTTDFYAL